MRTAQVIIVGYETELRPDSAKFVPKFSPAKGTTNVETQMRQIQEKTDKFLQEAHRMPYMARLKRIVAVIPGRDNTVLDFSGPEPVAALGNYIMTELTQYFRPDGSFSDDAVRFAGFDIRRFVKLFGLEHAATNVVAEKTILAAVQEVVDHVSDGLNPTEAVTKVAQDRKLGRDFVNLVCTGYNTGATNFQRETDRLPHELWFGAEHRDIGSAILPDTECKGLELRVAVERLGLGLNQDEILGWEPFKNAAVDACVALWAVSRLNLFPELVRAPITCHAQLIAMYARPGQAVKKKAATATVRTTVKKKTSTATK